MKYLFADGGYDRTGLMDKVTFMDFTIDVLRRIDTELGFKGLSPVLGG
ncbi:hypothetical protein [Nitrospirillum amazonense]